MLVISYLLLLHIHTIVAPSCQSLPISAETKFVNFQLRQGFCAPELWLMVASSHISTAGGADEMPQSVKMC